MRDQPTQPRARIANQTRSIRLAPAVPSLEPEMSFVSLVMREIAAKTE